MRIISGRFKGKKLRVPRHRVRPTSERLRGGLFSALGEEALTERDRMFLKFADLFEQTFITQGTEEDRSIEETLTMAWNMFTTIPKEDLKRIEKEYVEKYLV